MSPFLILVVLALIFAVLSMVPPMSTWPMLAEHGQPGLVR